MKEMHGKNCHAFKRTKKKIVSRSVIHKFDVWKLLSQWMERQNKTKYYAVFPTIFQKKWITQSASSYLFSLSWGNLLSESLIIRFVVLYVSTIHFYRCSALIDLTLIYLYVYTCTYKVDPWLDERWRDKWIKQTVEEEDWHWRLDFLSVHLYLIDYFKMTWSMLNKQQWENIKDFNCKTFPENFHFLLHLVMDLFYVSQEFSIITSKVRKTEA